MTNKQNVWANQKVYKAQHKAQFRLLMFVLGLFLFTNIGLAATGEQSISKAIDNTVYAMAVPAIIKGDPVNEDKSGKILKAYIYVLGLEDVDSSQAFPTAIGREVGNIPLMAGAYWRKIEVILDSPEQKWTGSMGDIAAIISNTATFTLGGTDDSVNDWLESRLARGAYVVTEACMSGGNKRFLIGNACKPAVLSEFDGGSTKDSTSTTVTFKQECGELYKTYVGNTPILQPQAITAIATALALVSGNDTYLIGVGTANTVIATLSGATDIDAGRIITVRGSGGTGPSVINNGAIFKLVGGSAWIANASSQISFRIFKDGASSFIAIEIAGSRT